MTDALPLDDALPLADAVVLDLSDEATAIGPRLLAELGARVVRVEPLIGDPLRARAPFVDGEPGAERALAHLLYNAGKQSVVLDLDSDAGWEFVERLAGAVDVVVAPLNKAPRAREFFRDGRFEAAHPGVGLVDVVFRRDDPELKATDLIGVAAGGLLCAHGYPDQPPDHPVGGLGYKQAAFLSAATAVALITERRHRGLGSRATISLQEAVASTVIQVHNQNQTPWGLPEARWRLNGRSSLLPTADGAYVAVALNVTAGETLPIWYEDATGRPCPHEIAFDEATGREGVGQAVDETCAAKPREWLIRRGQELRHYITPVQSVADIAADEHLQARGYFPEIEHPALEQALRRPRSPFRAASYAPRAAPAPQLGEHTAEVLRDLAGIPADEFERLRAEGVVAAESPAPGPAAKPQSSQPVPPMPPVTRTASLARDDLPLAGLRVLDFCWMAAGPLVTELLANLGADVVKVESATGMDRVRSSMLAPANPSLDHSAFFNDVNTDKRSITLNLRRPEATELVMQLLPDFDVVTSNYTPGTMEKWGLSYDALREVRPDIIYAAYSALGESGPRAGWKAIGNGVSGLCGITWHTGRPERIPAGMGLHTDFTLAPVAATQIMAALLHRDRTGEGQELEVAQYEAGLHLLDTELIDYLVNGVEAPRRGNRSPHHVPHGVFPSSGDDRWIAIAVRDAAEWAGLCAAMGRDDLATRPDLQAVEGRWRAEDELEAEIGEWTAAHDAWELAAELQRRGVPAGPVQDMDDIVERDAGMRDFFFEFENGGVEFRVQHQPFTWNGRRLPTRRSPFLGEDNARVFSEELGLSDDRFAELVAAEVIA